MGKHVRERLLREAHKTDQSDDGQCKNCVRVLGDLSSSFESHRGLRQGNGLPVQHRSSGRCYAVSRVRFPRNPSTLSVERMTWILLLEELMAVAELYTHLKREAAKIGLMVNASKTSKTK